MIPKVCISVTIRAECYHRGEFTSYKDAFDRLKKKLLEEEPENYDNIVITAVTDKTAHMDMYLNIKDGMDFDENINDTDICKFAKELLYHINNYTDHIYFPDCTYHVNEPYTVTIGTQTYSISGSTIVARSQTKNSVSKSPVTKKSRTKKSRTKKSVPKSPVTKKSRTKKSVPKSPPKSPVSRTKRSAPKACPEGSTRNPVTNRCRKDCKPGSIRNPKTNRCVKDRRK